MGLPLTDIAVLIAYVVGIVAFGCFFVRKSRTTEQFTAAGRSLPGWAVGLSIFGTYLSSNTFLGVPGKAYGSNWNSFVFSLSLPVAAWIGVRYFVPFYRASGEISAYHHLQKRFGTWARTYAVACYLLTQIARMGAIMFGVSLALHALLGCDIRVIIVVAGVLITLYTVLGGIEAVIWTDVVQSLILMGGALLVLALLLIGMPGGPAQTMAIGWEHSKFSLGSFGAAVGESTFWVVLFYGIFINLSNFGIDQSFVQRYHTARSDRDASKSLWTGALLYLPVSLVFFLIGSALFSYYQVHPAMLGEVRLQVAEANMAGAADATGSLQEVAAALTPADIGDKVLPHFVATRLRGGVAGLLIAAILAATMSSIDTSLNSSATVFLADIYRRYCRPDPDDRASMRVLHAATVVFGAIGTGVALAMMGVKSILDAWWQLQGVFAGGMLGLFLLGLIARRARSPAAAIALLVGVLVIAWTTFSPNIAALPPFLRSPFHANMTIVVGTLTIFLVGLGLSHLRRARKAEEPATPDNTAD